MQRADVSGPSQNVSRSTDSFAFFSKAFYLQAYFGKRVPKTFAKGEPGMAYVRDSHPEAKRSARKR